MAGSPEGTPKTAAPLPIQVDPMELLQHGGIVEVQTHLPKAHSSFTEHVRFLVFLLSPSPNLLLLQMGAPEVTTPEAEFALINILAKMVEAVRKVDPKKPESVVLQALNKTFVRPDTMGKLASGGPIAASNPAELQTPQFKEAMNALEQQVSSFESFAEKADMLPCFSLSSVSRRSSETRRSEMPRDCPSPPFDHERDLSNQSKPLGWNAVVAGSVATNLPGKISHRSSLGLIFSDVINFSNSCKPCI